jgi:2-methylisocitrate lyase-like PEP mutase family enzyme
MKTISKAIVPMPLNVMLVPGLRSIEELRKNGVRRLTAGAAIAMAALGLCGQLTKHFLAGSWDELFKVTVDYATTNALFASR